MAERHPDRILILKNAANEISPFLKIIFDQSLQMGKLPDDWVEDNVAPVFKKGDRHSLANYRPISLTRVCAKLLEHIFCKPIIHIITISLLIPDVGLVSFFKTNQYKHNKSVCCFILYGGMRYIKKTIL